MIQWAGDDEFTLDGVTYRCMTDCTNPDQQVILKQGRLALARTQER